MAKRTNVILRFFGFFLREGSALVLAGLIIGVIRFGFGLPNISPELDAETANSLMFQYTLAAATIAIGYLALQAIAVVVQPVGKESVHLVDILVSMVPLTVVGYFVVFYWPIGTDNTLVPFQWGVLWLGGTVSLIDVVLFSWINLKINKLAQEFVSTD